MKTVLINPLAPDAGTFPQGEFFRCTAPNMGLAYIAAALEEDARSVAVVDANAEGLQGASLEERLRCEAPDIVGVTATTTTLLDGYAAVRSARRAVPHAFMVMGGIHATRFPEGTLDECAALDAVSIGEGERTFCELVEALEAGEPLDGVKGLAFRREGKVVVTEPRPCAENLDALPLPARHLLPMERYASAGRPHRTASIVSSRGCPFQCRFCAAPFIAGTRYRARSAESLLDEIGSILDEFSMDTFEFVDDLFTLNRSRVVQLCQGILERGYEVSWSCSARADTVDPELLRLMAGAGCRIVNYGVESGSQRILDAIGKRETLDQMRDAVRWTREASMRSWGFFIIGFPDETPEEIQATIDFSLELGLDYAEFFICSAYPGSRLYEEAEAAQIIAKETWADISYGKANIANRYLSPEQLEALLRHAYRSFYTHPRIKENLLLYGQREMVDEIMRQTEPEEVL